MILNQLRARGNIMTLDVDLAFITHYYDLAGYYIVNDGLFA